MYSQDSLTLWILKCSIRTEIKFVWLCLSKALACSFALGYMRRGIESVRVITRDPSWDGSFRWEDHGRLFVGGYASHAGEPASVSELSQVRQYFKYVGISINKNWPLFPIRLSLAFSYERWCPWVFLALGDTSFQSHLQTLRNNVIFTYQSWASHDMQKDADIIASEFCGEKEAIAFWRPLIVESR